MNERALLAALGGIETPDAWKRGLLARTVSQKAGRKRRGKWPIVVLAALAAAAVSVTALAAADPGFKKWALHFMNITPQIDVSRGASAESEPQMPSNVTQTNDLGTDYRVDSGFLLLHPDTPDQKIYAYQDGGFVENEAKRCAGRAGTFSFSFQYVQNGAGLYTYGHAGSGDFTVDALPGHDGAALLFARQGAEKKLYQIDLTTGGMTRTLTLPSAFKGYNLSPDGSYAALKLFTATEGAFSWSLFDLSTGRNTALDSAIGSLEPYDAYFYDSTTLVLVLYNQDETQCSFRQYDVRTGAVKDLGTAANTPGSFWVDRSDPCIKQLDVSANKFIFKNIVMSQTDEFGITGLIPHSGPSATYGNRRFFICEIGTAQFVVFDLEKHRVSTVKAADIHCSTLQFASLVDNETMLLSGKASLSAPPSFYLVDLSR